MITHNRMTDRNWRIYWARVRDKRTLQSVADENNITRERVRQIVSKGGRVLEYMDALDAAPKDTLGCLVLSTRVEHAIMNESLPGWRSVKIRDFLRKHPHWKFRMYPNVGKKAVTELRDAVAAFDEEAATLWFNGEEIPK
jgi:hypothetical protein